MRMDRDGFVPLYMREDFSDVRYLVLMLGPACNMRCRHCFQIPERVKSDVSVKNVDERVVGLVRNFIRFSLSNPRPDGKPRRLYFYGGEPLLHWGLIRPFIERMSDEFRLADTDLFRFDLITNGLLLDEEKVRFFNDYKVRVSFSYDAPNPFAVRGYVPDSVCGLVNGIDDCLVLSTCSARNADILLAYRCLSAKFPKARIVIGYNMVHSFALPEDAYAYDWSVVHDNVRKLRIAVQMDDAFALDYVFRHFAVHLFGNDKGDVGDRLSCMRGGYMFSLSIGGDVYACYGCGYRLGTVGDAEEVLLARASDYAGSLASSRCSDCRHKDVCKSHCLLDLKDGDGYYLSCRHFLLRFFDIVKSELLLLSEPLSVGDREWFLGQEALMVDVVKKFCSEGGEERESD